MLRMRMTGKAARMTSDTMEVTANRHGQYSLIRTDREEAQMHTSLYNDQVLYSCFRKTCSRNTIGIPGAIHRSTLKDICKGDRYM